MKVELYEEFRQQAQTTEEPCECGSNLVLVSYGCIGGEGFGKMENCLDCSRTRTFIPDEDQK